MVEAEDTADTFLCCIENPYELSWNDPNAVLEVDGKLPGSPKLNFRVKDDLELRRLSSVGVKRSDNSLGTKSSPSKSGIAFSSITGV